MTRWGIIGAGNIADRFCESLKNVTNSELYAISGRNEEKLNAFAEKHPCRKIYVGYENLLKDENVDAVYIALPHAYHAEWIIKAAQYKKDILCEKPAVISIEEAHAVREAVNENGVIFMEAMKNVFEPAFLEVLWLVRKGKIGAVKKIDVQHGFALPKEMYGTSYHTSSEGGGCLYDVGCYGLGFLHPFVKGNMRIQKTYANVYNGVDMYVNTKMSFDDVQAELTCAFDRNLDSYGMIYGDKGTIKVSPLHRPNHYEITIDGVTDTFDIPYDNDDFYAEIDYFEQLRADRDMNNDCMQVADTVKVAEWSEQIRASFTQYEESDLAILEAQEKLFAMEQLSSKQALEIGNTVVELLEEYDCGISCQIVRESDQTVIFQYVSDDKKERNLKFAQWKHQSIYRFQHSSAWLNIAVHLNPAMMNAEHPEALPSGGAFPIRNSEGKLIASILVSGLHEGKDHELIIRTLEKATGKTAPVFVKALG